MGRHTTQVLDQTPAQAQKARRWDRILRRVDQNSKRLVLVGVVLILLQSLYTNYAILKERSDRRDQVNTSICAIIRAIPPGNTRIDMARTDLKCGPYTPPPLPSLPSRSSGPSKVPSSHASTPRTRTSSTPRGHPTTTARATSVVTHTPKPSIVTRTSTAIRHRTVTKTKSAPTKTVTKKPTPSPTPTKTGGLLDPICKLIPLLC